MILQKISLLSVPLYLALRMNAPVVDEVPIPIKDGHVTSAFGRRVHPIFKVTRFHAGIDIAGPKEAPVHAVGTGLVIFAGPYRGYGNLVVLKHTNGISTHYAHLGSIQCSIGQIVSTNSTLGIVGNSGHATAPHLHFEVRKFGNPIDPRRVIPAFKKLIQKTDSQRSQVPYD
jgi:murein DD-endopeptidase MepM/ murein hydrolase activator NlpD